MLQSTRHSACCLPYMSPADSLWAMFAGLSLPKQLSWLPSAATHFTAPAVLAFVRRNQAAQ